jgi:hypothetical protein
MFLLNALILFWRHFRRKELQNKATQKSEGNIEFFHFCSCLSKIWVVFCFRILCQFSMVLKSTWNSAFCNTPVDFFLLSLLETLKLMAENLSKTGKKTPSMGWYYQVNKITRPLLTMYFKKISSNCCV